jgi:glycosyltransferase involved in cell wall biosynthesis
MPKVSVIVPVFNRAFMIRDVICSVAAQTYGNVELVIVDDGSTDITEELEAFIAATPIGSNPIKFIRIPNAGVSHARNVGIGEAAGAYLSFLDSDDNPVLDPEKVGPAEPASAAGEVSRNLPASASGLFPDALDP